MGNLNSFSNEFGPTVQLFCLKTVAKDKFITTQEENCMIKEEIHYECPLILVPLCRAELYSQRTKVLGNLQDQMFE